MKVWTEMRREICLQWQVSETGDRRSIEIRLVAERQAIRKTQT
ncbi:hypothetical protein C943_00395 [Mariniradius saccharolyticus AK6]|uniref:Uncharacterized protein n=1 Tax=Mariniradius saccharolyticus AK6 TaxID=1239962 RepID=M7XEZ1_9BACT|nr:hypothetical protein C943_00395 [Mariniradius saccharolyticus AK6]